MKGFLLSAVLGLVAVSLRQCVVLRCISGRHRNRPGGLRPRGLGEKQKRRAGQSLHSVRRDPSACDTTAGTSRQNHPLQERPDYRIIFHAVRPNGRCVGGRSTCAGFQVLAHLETAAFLFFMSIIPRLSPTCKPFPKLTGRDGDAVPPLLPCRFRQRFPLDKVSRRSRTKGVRAGCPSAR